MVPALLTTVLLFLSGDMVGLWALSWIALVPLCFACRGAGGPAAFLLAAAAFLPAAVLQSFWLMDVDGTNPLVVWLVTGLVPPLAFFAIELPITKSVPWLLRPLLLAALLVGLWHLLPGDAEFLIPFGGLIDSELVRFTYPMVGLSLMAGLFTGLAWLAAEMFHNPRQRGRTGWTGIAAALVLAAACGADWVGASVKPHPVGVQHVTGVFVVAGNEPLPKAGDSPELGDALVVWTIEADDEEFTNNTVSNAANFAEERNVNMVLMVHHGGEHLGYFFARTSQPAVAHTWQSQEQEPLSIEGTRKPVLDSVGVLRICPGLNSPEHWAGRIDLELYLSVEDPAHPAQLGYWLREQRREALIRGSRQVSTWNGGAVVIDGAGRIIARTDGEPVLSQLPAQKLSGQSLGRARLTVVEKILAMSTPVILVMLLLLTPVRWAKIRYRANREASSTVAIEEITDGETTLSKEQTETITRRFEKPD